MQVFSCEFLLLWGTILLLFYVKKGKRQWVFLLVGSLYFYIRCISAPPIVLVVVSISSYVISCLIQSERFKQRENAEIIKKQLKWMSILINLSCLVFGRVTNVVALLGNSYFTLKAIGYVIDVERGNEEPAESYFKFLLYLIFFPAVSQGPFNRYAEFAGHFKQRILFNYSEFCHGLQRFLLGCFKKLIMAERLALIVKYVYSDLENMPGLGILLATVAYALQIYMDFAGYMDMMLGVAMTFGIKLPENFARPYFATSVSEFWRRWHITLGHWFRDYVMYGFIMSKHGRRLTKFAKKKSKKWGKVITPAVGTILVWLCTGLWHGFHLSYLIWGIYYGLIICFSLLLEPVYEEMRKRWNINIKSRVYQGICMIRTWCFVLIADMMIRVNHLGDLETIGKQVLYRFGDIRKAYFQSFGWTMQDYVIVLLGGLLVIILSHLEERGQAVLQIVDRQSLLVRWGIYYAMFFFVLIWGMYGSGYDTSQFLYMQF